jgi:hypothetical protein
MGHFIGNSVCADPKLPNFGWITLRGNRRITLNRTEGIRIASVRYIFKMVEAGIGFATGFMGDGQTAIGLDFEFEVSILG